MHCHAKRYVLLFPSTCPMQDQIAASSEQGLAELLASSAGAAGQQQGRRREDEWVLVDPAQLLDGLM